MTKPNIPENKTIPIAESGNQGGIRMWPSEEWASKLADWANFGLIASLIAGVISTVLLVWMGNVKETYLKMHLIASNERAAEAELKLETLRRQVAARHVQRDVFFRAVAGQPKARVELMYLRDDPECFELAQEIWRVLQDAQWDVIAPVPIPPSVASANLQSPTSMSVGGQPSGVTVVTHSVSDKEAEADLNSKNWEHTPWTVLSNALLQSLGQIKGSGGGPNSPPEGTLRVVVAPRL